MINTQRIRNLTTTTPLISKNNAIIYWMSRDQRINDNWALLYAQEIALEYKLPLAVIFCFMPKFLGATTRMYEFMTSGLEFLEKDLMKYNIPFLLLQGPPEQEIPKFINSYSISHLICDFSPLKINREWKNSVAKKITIPFYEVDAHNIIPCWHASPKLEFGAYTIRPKIQKFLPTFLEKFPMLQKHPHSWKTTFPKNNWNEIKKSLPKIPSFDWITSGEHHAQKMLTNFISSGLQNYDVLRNNPTYNAQSNLSPYLHFGQISAQRIALEVSKTKKSPSQENFLEELIVRRELADNFCFYNPKYDSFDGFPTWAKTTLNEHRKDKREFLYSLEEFEHAKTHDELWNAAQLQMVRIGKMHGFMRMYWAKKILEWTTNPEEAMEIAIYLNDTYELDGRDPNGYTGIAWSIGGVHDRAWFERPIFGKIRYMNYNGCARKFDVKKYISSINNDSLF